MVWAGRRAKSWLELLAENGKGRALVVSTRSPSGPQGLKQSEIAESLESGVRRRLYGSVSAHSPRDDVIAAAGEARRLQADILVAIGGQLGDRRLYKVAQLAVWNALTDADALDPYRAGARAAARRRQRLALDPLRMIAIPTTLVGGRVHAVRRRYRHAPAYERGLRPSALRAAGR